MTKTPETWADVRTQGALHRRADQVADFVRHVAGLETPDEYDQRTDGDGMSGDDAVNTLGSLVVWARGLQQPYPGQTADDATGARLVGVEGLGDKAISLDDALTAARVIGMVTLALKSTTYGLTADQVQAIAVGAANAFIDTVEGHGMMPAAPEPEGGKVRAWMFRESPSERWHVTMDRRSVDEYLKAFSTAEVHPLAIATREQAAQKGGAM